ncbi:hypothetical protein C8J56DRAFT_1115038 [Mycena floridula]|nr:hypothetical protein C8J56DRAFT_1115038 [Mycena floridula]
MAQAKVTSESSADPPPREKQRQGTSSLMQPFIDIKDHIQSFYITTHADSRTANPCSECCSGDMSSYRCSDCWLRLPCCASCIVKQHELMPFHHIEEWTGQFFRRILLRDLGVLLCLGHNGARCSNCIATHPGRRLTVVHTNGVHKLHVLFCMCKDAVSESDQLFHAQLFPGTLTLPQTAFTFDVLNQFHIHTNESKKAAYDFHGALQRLTDNVFPDNVTDHYRSFQRITRLHRVLAGERRAGLAHGMQELVPESRSDSIVLHCTACPEPGFNVSHEEIAAVKPNKRHKYTIFLGTDGTFNMPQIKKPNDPDDISLNAGRGEKYSAADYALASALERIGLRQRWIKLCYDIWCQYSINLVERFEREFAHLAPLVREMTGLIGPVHIVSHIKRCHALFLANTTESAGRACSDNIEQPFVETKTTGGSTKHMNGGHRHDVLDDFHNFWNYKKMTDMGRSLATRYQAAFKKLQKLERSFNELSEGYPSSQIEAWEQLYNSPRPSPLTKDPVDLFESRLVPAKLSLKAKLKEVVDTEMVKILSSTTSESVTTMSTVLLSAVQLDIEMHLTKCLASTKELDAKDKEKLQNGRKRLCPKIISAIANLRKAFPALSRHLDSLDADQSVDPDKPERFSLPLPSNLTDTVQTACDLTDAANVEYKLREGQAFDLLENIRLDILSLMDDARELASCYNHCRQALLRLGLSLESSTFQELKLETQLWIKDPNKARKPGENQIEDPWYWRTAMPDDLTEVQRDEWVTEMLRVKWFRDRADRDRFREEVDTLVIEKHRTETSHSKMATNWMTLATNPDRPLRNPGHIAYAFKQANLHHRLLKRCQDEWIKEAEKSKKSDT